MHSIELCVESVLSTLPVEKMSNKHTCNQKDKAPKKQGKEVPNFFITSMRGLFLNTNACTRIASVLNNKKGKLSVKLTENVKLMQFYMTPPPPPYLMLCNPLSC